ncbi:hypothetical protein GKZ90_0005170 [Flavobacterium sp. MC2016-06]|jgi:hypothetical protein|uniref:hypothetical protein n=1 Tax=Flavobacterium sp. MC2016-06 TaxID=2676308 RepID=UPI0012BAB6DF|nr:hypothetical protein [Flavobacterium sp. MC2016-06]MBU3857526.1 hypothetical protein [Flavobacterium sp. MC2016-06]
MKKWSIKILLSLGILLCGYATVHGYFTPFSENSLHTAFHIKTSSDKANLLDRNQSFERFKRKGCLVDNEENDENFSSIQKQLVKNNYFLNFLCSDKAALYSSTLTKKVNTGKIFSLPANKVYLLFQVFRI